MIVMIVQGRSSALVELPAKRSRRLRTRHQRQSQLEKMIRRQLQLFGLLSWAITMRVTKKLTTKKVKKPKSTRFHPNSSAVHPGESW